MSSPTGPSYEACSPGVGSHCCPFLGECQRPNCHLWLGPVSILCGRRHLSDLCPLGDEASLLLSLRLGHVQVPLPWPMLESSSSLLCRNKCTYIGIAVALAVAAVVIYVPGLNNVVLGGGPVPVLALLAPVAAGLLLLAYELLRIFLRRRGTLPMGKDWFYCADANPPQGSLAGSPRPTPICSNWCAPQAVYGRRSRPGQPINRTV